MFNNSDVVVKPRMDDPVDPAIVEELLRKCPEFGKTYNKDGFTIAKFDTFGGTECTLRSFVEAYRELTSIARGRMRPKV